MTGQFRFKKTERLSGKKRIETLFREGNSLFYSPFRVIWLLSGQDNDVNPVARIAVAVSKKKFRKAVLRNLVKRRMREAYRKNKRLLTDWLKEKNQYLDVVFIYTGSQILSYRNMEEKIIVTLHKIIEENEKVDD